MGGVTSPRNYKQPQQIIVTENWPLTVKNPAPNQNDGWMNEAQTNQQRDPSALLLAGQQEQETSRDVERGATHSASAQHEQSAMV